MSVNLMKENCLILKNARSRRYPVKTIPDADYADDLAILVNTPTQTKFLLHSLEQAAIGIGLSMNANKTSFPIVKGGFYAGWL